MSAFIKMILIVQMIIFSFFGSGNHISSVTFSNMLTPTEYGINSLSESSNYKLIESKSGDISQELVEQNSNVSFTNTFSFEKDAIIGKIDSKLIINDINLDKIVRSNYKMVFNKHDFKICESEPYINVSYLIEYYIIEKSGNQNLEIINYSIK